MSILDLLDVDIILPPSLDELPLSMAESNNFIDGPQATRLTQNRALFRDDSMGAIQLEKFKPYDLPSPEELLQFRTFLGAKHS